MLSVFLSRRSLRSDLSKGGHFSFFSRGSLLMPLEGMPLGRNPPRDTNPTPTRQIFFPVPFLLKGVMLIRATATTPDHHPLLGRGNPSVCASRSIRYASVVDTQRLQSRSATSVVRDVPFCRCCFRLSFDKLTTGDAYLYHFTALSFAPLRLS